MKGLTCSLETTHIFGQLRSKKNPTINSHNFGIWATDLWAVARGKAVGTMCVWAQHLVMLQSHFSWQGHYLVMLQRHFSWQPHHLVMLERLFLWPVLRFGDVTASLHGRRSMWWNLGSWPERAMFEFFHTKCVSEAGKVASAERAGARWAVRVLDHGRMVPPV